LTLTEGEVLGRIETGEGGGVNVGNGHRSAARRQNTGTVARTTPPVPMTIST
jgi:hypothetical protein